MEVRVEKVFDIYDNQTKVDDLYILQPLAQLLSLVLLQVVSKHCHYSVT